MSNTLSNLMISLLFFTAIVAFWGTFIAAPGQNYYGVEEVAGITALSDYSDENEQALDPFVSQVQSSEIEGTQAYLSWASIPQILSAVTSLINIPTVLINLMTQIGLYVIGGIPDWLRDFITQLTILVISILVSIVLLGREY